MDQVHHKPLLAEQCNLQEGPVDIKEERLSILQDVVNNDAWVGNSFYHPHEHCSLSAQEKQIKM